VARRASSSYLLLRLTTRFGTVRTATTVRRPFVRRDRAGSAEHLGEGRPEAGAQARWSRFCPREARSGPGPGPHRSLPKRARKLRP